MTRIPALGPRGEGWVVAQSLLLGLATIAGLTTGDAWTGPLRLATDGLALLPGVGGALLATRGLRDLRTNLTALPKPKADGELVETGIYARVRHPIYGGLVLLALAWGLFTASPAAHALAFVLLGFFHLKAAREEIWLQERFPGYRAYRARTRRLIPWIG